jgi:CheY-like chemotaxis protein
MPAGIKRKLLLIDADIQLNKVHEKILLSSGVTDELRIAVNGKEALKYLKCCVQNNDSLPQVIVFELRLPVMDGFQFIEEWDKLDCPGKSRVELVVFTSSSSPKDREKAMSKGIRYYLSKPYLLRGLQEVLSHPRPACSFIGHH